MELAGGWSATNVDTILFYQLYHNLHFTIFSRIAPPKVRLLNGHILGHFPFLFGCLDTEFWQEKSILHDWEIAFYV